MLMTNASTAMPAAPKRRIITRATSRMATPYVVQAAVDTSGRGRLQVGDGSLSGRSHRCRWRLKPAFSWSAPLSRDLAYRRTRPQACPPTSFSAMAAFTPILSKARPKGAAKPLSGRRPSRFATATSSRSAETKPSTTIAGPATKVIDLKGRTRSCLGFNDAHADVFLGGLTLSRADLSGTTNLTQLLEKVKAVRRWRTR